MFSFFQKSRVVRWFARCDEPTYLFSVSRDRRLTLGERLRLAVHPWICRPCREHVRQSRRMYALIRTEADASGTPPVPDEVRRRLEERVLREIARK